MGARRRYTAEERRAVISWRSSLAKARAIDCYLSGDRLVCRQLEKEERALWRLPADATPVGRYRHPCPTEVFIGDWRAVRAALRFGGAR